MTRAAEQQVEITTRRGGVLVRLNGVIDEHFDLSGLAGLRGTVVIDLDGVHRITSYGVRQWLAALAALPADYWCYVRCRPSMVTQFNMVHGFGGRGQLVTLYAPYVCSACGAEVQILIDLRHQHGNLESIGDQPVDCPNCQGKADFDDVADSYFAHACGTKLRVPAVAQAILDDGGRPQLGLRVEKEVSGKVTALWLAGCLDGRAQFRRVADGLEGTVVVVMGDVEDIDAQGCDRFKALTCMPGCVVNLANVRLAVALALSRARAIQAAQVLSLRFAMRCADCAQQVDVDADHDRVRFIVAGEPGGPRCKRCNAPLVDPPPELEQATELPWGRPDTDLADYLLSRESPTLIHSPIAGRRDASPVSTSQPLSGRAQPLDLPSHLGRYEITSRIAHGGMGVVYLGRVIGAGGFERRVAVKVMHAHLAQDAQFVAMFLDEARLAARIYHPNVVATLDVDQGPAGPFLVMDYIEGLSLHTLTRRLRRAKNALSPAVALRMVIDVLAGLHAAHELRGPGEKPLRLVHRDVSPQNLIVGVDGITRVTDFGIARAESRLVASTGAGQVKGKIPYMAPEQLRSDALDRRSDVYSAGIVAWELLAGERLFKGDNEGAILMATLTGATQSPSEVNRAVPADVGEAVLRALVQNRDERYPNAAAFAEALEDAARRALIAVASARAVGEVAKKLMVDAAEPE